MRQNKSLKDDLFGKLQEEYRLYKIICLEHSDSCPISFSAYCKQVITKGALSLDRDLLLPL